MTISDISSLHMLDWIFLSFILVSAALGLFRGFTREALSIVTWVAAGFIAYYFSKDLLAISPFNNWLHTYISDPNFQPIAAFLIVFIAALIAGSIVSLVLRSLVSMTGLGSTDMLLGMVFGVARGVIVLSLMVFAIELTPLAENIWWKKSILLPHIQVASHWLNQHVSDISKMVT